MKRLLRQPRLQRPRRGVMLALLILLMVMFSALATLAVDYGHVQLVKSEMQRVADVTARGYMEHYIATNSQTYASGSALYSSTNNPVDGTSAIRPTVTVTWGYWNTTTNTFSTTSGTVTAVQVTVTRTSTGANAVPLFWGGMLGFHSVDIHATAVAAEMGGQTASLTVPSTSDLYLAGMPAGSTSVGGDTTTNAPPYQVASIPVTPGTWMTFTGMTGTVSVAPGSVAATGPAGNSSYPVYHGQSFDNNPDSPTSENGIADARMYDNAAAGVFLTNSAPNIFTPPATVDWTQSSQMNQPAYTNLVVQAPFLIGAGVTTGGTTQQFLVPPATRLFLGIWDGYEYSNDSGTFTGGTVTVLHYVQLVQ